MNDIALTPMCGAALCSNCHRRFTVRYIGKRNDPGRKPVCSPCQGRPIADGRATYLPAKGAS